MRGKGEGGAGGKGSGKGGGGGHQAVQQPTDAFYDHLYINLNTQS